MHPHMNPMGFHGGPPVQPMMFRGGPPVGPYGMQPAFPPRGGFVNPAPFHQMNRPPVVVPAPNHVDPVAQQLTLLGLEPVATNVWVGKICPFVEDFMVKKLLDACGQVATWTRVEANGQLKTFGFCKFTNAEGALRSLRLLNGLSIGTEQLHLKVDQNTTEYLDGYEKKKKTYLESLENGENKNSEAGDKVAKEIIESISNQISKAMNGDEEVAGVIVNKDMRAFRERQMKLEKEKKEKEEQEEKRRRQKEEEEKQQQRRQQEREERELREKERKWCDYEKDRTRSRKHYFEEIKERQISRKKRLLLDDEDDKSHRKKIKSREARKKRQREKEEDDHEKAKEDHELELLRREQEKQQEEEARRKKEEERRRIQEMAEKTKMDLERMKEEKLRMERMQQEKMLQEKEQAEKLKVERQELEEKKKTFFSVSLSQVGQLAKKSNVNHSLAAPMFSAEADESDESNLKKKRKLMVLEHEVGNHEDRDEKKNVLDVKAKAQAVIDKIPTQKEDLFKFPIDWAIVDQYKIVEEKMNIWVKKKIVEYLGEEEQSLVNYICKKLVEHTPPDLLLESLIRVLEEEAADFVIKMWRMLIYNILMITNDK